MLEGDELLIFRLVAGILVGLALGSFVTMASYRLPRRKSIVAPRSSCVTCGTVLRARDLVPLISWIINRGRCAHCGTRVSARYPLIELTVAICVTTAVVLVDSTFWLIPTVVALVACLIWIVIRVERR